MRFPILTGFKKTPLAQLRALVSRTDKPVAGGAGGAHPGKVWRGIADWAGAAAEDRTGGSRLAGVFRVSEAGEARSTGDRAGNCSGPREDPGRCPGLKGGGGLFARRVVQG